MGIDINPEQINQLVSEAIIKSAIGSSLKTAIDEEVARMGRSYDNPYNKLVEAEIIKQIKELVETEFNEQIKAKAREYLADDFLNQLLSTLFDKFLGKRW